MPAATRTKVWNVQRLRTSRGLSTAILVSALAVSTTLSCGGGGEEQERPENWDAFLDETIIAKMGDETLTARDLDDRLRLNFTQLYDGYSLQTERSIRDVLKLELEHIALALEAERVGFADTSHDFKVVMEAARRNILQQFFVTEVLHQEVEPTEEEVRRRYEENKEAYVVPRQSVIQHILVATREDAEAALTRIENGEEFNDVVADVTLDEANNITGSVGWVREGEPIRGLGELPAFTEAALEMEPGEYRIIETEKGWHVLHCFRRQDAGYRPFEEVRESILDAMRKQRQAVNLDLKLREYRGRYGARVFDENLAAYLAWRRQEPEAELWARAEAETDPTRKIAVYEEYIARFPQSEHACEARFMIGFTLAEEARDRNRARVALRDFIRECPDSKLVESAEFMMNELSSAKP
jgi:hypothetical protein